MERGYVQNIRHRDCVPSVPAAVPLPFQEDSLQEALELISERDILPVSDGQRAYPPCATALGIRYEALNLSAVSSL